MASENDYIECISFYGDENLAKKSEMKRKADEILDENEITAEKSRGKILRFAENVTEIGDTGESKNVQEAFGLAEVPEIKSHPSDEESFAIVPRGPEFGEQTSF